jgi:transcriptional regulator with XRE-family HTH domain
VNPVPSSAYERLVAAAARLKVPDAVRTVATNVPADPEPGQIWRAAWEGTVELLALTRVGTDTVQALPLSLERFYDERTLLLPGPASTLEQPFALWCGLEAVLPWYVLDRQIAQLTAPLPPDAVSPGAEAPSGARWGTAAPSPAAPTAEFRAALSDTMDRLRTATHWTPPGNGDLPRLLLERHITAAQLAEHLGLAPPQALALWRGQVPATPAQAQRLSTLLDLSEDEVIAANPALPDGAARELSRPVRRWQIKRLAVQESRSEAEVRTRAAFEVFALATRQTGGGEVDWAARADRYFQIRLPQDRER